MVKRVFITSDLGEDALPKWASWVKVVVDGGSRELLCPSTCPHCAPSRGPASERVSRDAPVDQVPQAAALHRAEASPCAARAHQGEGAGEVGGAAQVVRERVQARRGGGHEEPREARGILPVRD